MYYILKSNIKNLGLLINELKKRNLVRSEYSYNEHEAFGVATHFAGTDTKEFIVLSERMCCSDPKFSWVTYRKQCSSEEEFLSKIDEKLKNK
jgi:hypothetical protein